MNKKGDESVVSFSIEEIPSCGDNRFPIGAIAIHLAPLHGQPYLSGSLVSTYDAKFCSQHFVQHERKINAV